MMIDKWAEYKRLHCGCKDASRLNQCRGLAICELPANNAERQKAEAKRIYGLTMEEFNAEIDSELMTEPCQHLPITSQFGTWCELCEKKLD